VVNNVLALKLMRWGIDLDFRVRRSLAELFRVVAVLLIPLMSAWDRQSFSQA